MAAKRRGRPSASPAKSPKVAKEDPALSDDSEDSNPFALPPGKGRGRPRKAPSMIKTKGYDPEEGRVIPMVGRGRGRPKKDPADLITKGYDPETGTIVRPEGPGRGRPKKDPSKLKAKYVKTGKARGRPPKAKTA